MPVPAALLVERGPQEFRDALLDGYAQSFAAERPQLAHEASQLASDGAVRAVRAAGWFKSSDGTWKRLAPDLRGKINIRKGAVQPDGKVLVEDVEVFYPNQVKGDDEASNYTPEKIREIIRNSNAAYNSGSQPPGLVKEHPTQGRKDNGVATPAHGYGFAFRESEKGPGWTKCHVLMSPEVFAEWRDGKWLGLSAGFACDKNATNMRFGHIALLGADMQALSKLPRTEVYSADGLAFDGAEAWHGTVASLPDNQLMFAADTGLVEHEDSARGADNQTRRHQMPEVNTNLTNEQKLAFSAMAAAHGALNDAFAAFAAGASDAGEKDRKAQEQFASATEKMRACGYAADEGDEGDEGEGDGGGGGGGEGADGTNNPLNDERANTPTPEEVELDALLAEEPPASTDVGQAAEGDAGDAQFASLSAELQQVRAERVADQKVIAALIGKQMNDEFKTFCAEKQRKGHQFDAASSFSLFAAVAANPEAVRQLKRTIENSPLDPKVAGNGLSTFSAEDATKRINGGDQGAGGGAGAGGGNDSEAVLALLRERMPGVNFSANDVHLGMVATNCK